MNATGELKTNARELSKKAQSAIDPLSGARVTLLLPDSWPKPHGALFYAYRSAPLSTGVVAYSISGPVFRILFAPLDDSPRVETFKPVRTLGREDKAIQTGKTISSNTLAEAEQTLLEVIAGRRTVEEAVSIIEPYRYWLETRPRIAEDLATREPAFIQWLLKKPR